MESWTLPDYEHALPKIKKVCLAIIFFTYVVPVIIWKVIMTITLPQLLLFDFLNLGILALGVWYETSYLDTY